MWRPSAAERTSHPPGVNRRSVSSPGAARPPLSLSLIRIPNFFAAARILGRALAPNGDWGALDRALRTCGASWMGKFHRERATVLPLESFDPPLSMKANAESGRSLMDWAVICAIG